MTQPEAAGGYNLNSVGKSLTHIADDLINPELLDDSLGQMAAVGEYLRWSVPRDTLKFTRDALSTAHNKLIQAFDLLSDTRADLTDYLGRIGIGADAEVQARCSARVSVPAAPRAAYLVNPKVSYTAHRATVKSSRCWGIPVATEVLPRLEPGAWVLDLGCGTTDSRLMTALRGVQTNDHNVLSLDHFQEVLAGRTDPNRVRSNGLELPLGSNSLDVVVTSEVTPDNDYFRPESGSNVSRTRQALGAEISRVLKKGGHWLVYNEAIRYDELPPGFITEFALMTQPLIMPEGAAQIHPFAVYRKNRDILSEDLVGRNVAGDSDKCTDSFTRALDESYPVNEVLGNGLAERILTEDDYAYIAYLPLHEEVRALVRQVLTDGVWSARLVSVPGDNPAEHVKELAGPDRYRAVHKSPDRATSNDLLNCMDSSVFTVKRYDDRRAIIVPSQYFCDRLLAAYHTQRTQSGSAEMIIPRGSQPPADYDDISPAMLLW